VEGGGGGVRVLKGINRIHLDKVGDRAMSTTYVLTAYTPLSGIT